MLSLYDKVTAVKGLGPVAAKALFAAGVKTVRDLLFYFPYRYEDFSRVKHLNELRAGETVTVFVEVVSVAARRSFKSCVMVTEAKVKDATGTLVVKWFQQPFLAKSFKPGMRLALAGLVDKRKDFVLVNPRYERLEGEVPLHAARLIPIYPRSSSIGEKRLRNALAEILPLADRLTDAIPEDICSSEGFLSLPMAIRHIHFPEKPEDIHAAVERLKFDELFLHGLLFAHVRKERQEHRAISVPVQEDTLRQFVAMLPFALTAGQKRAAWEIVQDLAHEHPMNRLLEGDVGSGKTVVAAMAILSTLEAGKNAVYLAPTEILASQQYENFRRWLPSFHVAIKTRSQQTKNLSPSQPFLLVGTHAILQDGVDTDNAALVVVDEQHRFGVQDRHKLLSGKDPVPHLLSMSATPIPRSLALTLHGDLDLSILPDLPSGRQKIGTHIVTDAKERAMFRHISSEIEAGHVVYVVCPLIDPSDTLGVISVEEAWRQLCRVFPGGSVAKLHGRMKGEEKEKMLADFRSGKTPVLVTTSVVEVGVDVPRATVMVIEGAERFGLAQLHQLRGRVGRSTDPSVCFLRVRGDGGEMARRRLEAMTRCQNGFELAELDLQFRGPGNLFGDAQSGFPDFKLATLADVVLMKKARDWASHILENDPELSSYPRLREHLDDVIENVHLE